MKRCTTRWNPSITSNKRHFNGWDRNRAHLLCLPGCLLSNKSVLPKEFPILKMLARQVILYTRHLKDEGSFCRRNVANPNEYLCTFIIFSTWVLCDLLLTGDFHEQVRQIIRSEAVPDQLCLISLDFSAEGAFSGPAHHSTDE